MGTPIVKSDGTYAITADDMAKFKWDMTGENAREFELVGDGTAAVIKLQSALAAPTITTQPVSKTGDAALTYGSITTSDTLSVTATGDTGAELSYQWQLKTVEDEAETWKDVSGATAATFTIPNTLGAGTYVYRCVVTATKDGSTKSTESASATVTVKKAAMPDDIKITPYRGIYDGKTYPVFTVSGTDASYTVKSKAGTASEYSDGIFTATDAATAQTAYYKISHPNYETKTGSVEYTIAPQPLTVTGTTIDPTKVYDGTTTAKVTATGTLSGLIKGETLTLTCTATYDTKTVGTGKPVTLTYKIANGTTGKATNYIVPAKDSTQTADITAKALTVTGAAAKTRAYDSTNAVAITGGTLDGVFSGDSVSLIGTPTGTVESTDIGSSKPVTVTGYTLDGNSKGNYTLTQPTDVTVDITAATPTVTLADKKASYTGASIAIDAATVSGVNNETPGGAVTYTYYTDAACTQGAATTAPSAIGVYYVKASIAANGNYAAATSTAAQLTITYAPLADGTIDSVFKDYDTVSGGWSKDTSGVKFETADGWRVSETAPVGNKTSITFTDENDGTTKKTIYVKDSEGNVYQTEITYKLDTTAPTIEDVTTPAAVWGKADEVIHFTPADATSQVDTVTVQRAKQGDETEDVSYTVTDNSFAADRNGTYTITVTDHAGNQKTETVTISYIDKTAPSITVTPKISGTAWYGKTEFTVVTDDHGESGEVSVTVKQGNADVALAEGKFTADEALAKSYIYTVTAKDAVGNIATETITIQLDTSISDFMDKIKDLNADSDFSDLASAKDDYDKLSQITKDHIASNDEAKKALEKLIGLIDSEAAEAAEKVAEDIAAADTIEKIEQAKKDFDSLPEDVQNSVDKAIKDQLNQKSEDAKKAKDALDQLKNAAKPGASYEEKESAKEAFDKLTEEQKELAKKESGTDSNYSEISKDLAAMDTVLDLIGKIKKPYTADSKTDIAAAKDAFDELTEDQKNAFPKAENDKLKDLISKLNKVEAVETAINTADVNKADADIIRAKGEYDALTGDEKAMVDPALKTKLDELYKAMLAEKSEAEKEKIEAGKDFIDKVNDAKNDPTLEKIKDLLDGKDKLPDGVYDSLPDSVKKDFEDLQNAKDIIQKLENITKDNITGEDGSISNAAKDALEKYDKLPDGAIKDIVDKATDNKVQDIKDVKETLDKISKIPGHDETSQDENGNPDLSDCGNTNNSGANNQGSGGHTSDDHQQAIEDAKDALESLPDSAKDLIPEDEKELVTKEYEKLLGYLEYINRAVTDNKTEVEVVGITNKLEMPADSAAAGKTVIALVAKDSHPVTMPATPDGKSEMISVDVKLVASLYTHADDTTPVATEIVQPKSGETILVKLKLPTSYKTETLEIWHVKDNGARSRITDFHLATEADGTYAVFGVSNFSHFVFFAEKVSSGGNGGGSVTPITPKPSIPDTDHGSVTINPQQPKPGSTVTVTPKPDDGYVVDQITVKDETGKELPIKKNEDGSYAYTQPSGQVSITVTFKPEHTDLPFTDVPADAYYKDAVKWAYENGITGGTSATLFNPNGICTRAQTVTFLWRAMGSPELTSAVNPFTDVIASAYYYKAVLWAVEKGITKGTGATTFSPDATVTRGQTVTFLWRTAGAPAVSTENPFQDVDGKAYYCDAVLWAVKEGVTSGTSATTFAPVSGCTRAQIVTFLYRYLGK